MTRLAIMPVGVAVPLSQHLVNCNSHCRKNVPSCFEVWELQITSLKSHSTLSSCFILSYSLSNHPDTLNGTWAEFPLWWAVLINQSCTGSEVLLDASMEEEKWGDGGMIVAAMTSRNEITQLTMTGEWPSTKVSEALQLCLDACLKLAELMRSCLKEQVVAGGQ
jgi:hypothetical protein